MIDADELVFMTSEDYTKEMKERQAAIRDLLNDIDVLTSRFLNERNLTAEETAEYLRCRVDQIPYQIPCVHRGRDYLYKQVDIEKWLRENRKPKKSKELF
jgi:hypothetical protein